jgi:hypothetical protein
MVAAGPTLSIARHFKLVFRPVLRRSESRVTISDSDLPGLTRRAAAREARRREPPPEFQVKFDLKFTGMAFPT